LDVDIFTVTPDIVAEFVLLIVFFLSEPGVDPFLKLRADKKE
jgi:hypothetical protein